MKDSSGRSLPKVFIAYPHKPTVYIQMEADISQYRLFFPSESDDELRRRLQQSMQCHENQRREEIRVHKEKVRGLATFLHQFCVAVAYDQLLLDTGADNIMRWCQEQVEGSDFVILIVTESFNEFLNGEVPPESEQLFVGNYLSNFVNNPGEKRLLPVFLDQPVNSRLIPKCVEMCTLYSIYTPPAFGRGDDLEALYSLLTNQQQYAPPTPAATGPIQLNSRRRRSEITVMCTHTHTHTHTQSIIYRYGLCKHLYCVHVHIACLCDTMTMISPSSGPPGLSTAE